MRTSTLFFMMLSVVLLSACASQESFRKMDTSSRVKFVCEQDKAVQSAERDIKQNQKRINEINNELERGYQVFSSCKNIEIEEEKPISCKSYDAQSKQYTDCVRDKKVTHKRVCSDQVVQLNVSLAKENLQRHRSALEGAQQRKQQAYLRCQSKVENMNADEAYQYYLAQ